MCTNCTIRLSVEVALGWGTLFGHPVNFFRHRHKDVGNKMEKALRIFQNNKYLSEKIKVLWGSNPLICLLLLSLYYRCL